MYIIHAGGDSQGIFWMDPSSGNLIIQNASLAASTLSYTLAIYATTNCNGTSSVMKTIQHCKCVPVHFVQPRRCYRTLCRLATACPTTPRTRQSCSRKSTSSRAPPRPPPRRAARPSERSPATRRPSPSLSCRLACGLLARN